MTHCVPFQFYPFYHSVKTGKTEAGGSKGQEREVSDCGGLEQPQVFLQLRHGTCDL